MADPLGDFPETLVSRGSVMFIESREEVAARIKSLVDGLRAAVEVELPERFLVELEGIVLGDRFRVFWRILTAETPARVAPKRLTPKQDADLTPVKAMPRLYPPEKSGLA